MDLTGDEIATTLVMERQTDPRLVLVVEGDEDCSLIDVHLNEQTCKTVVSHSKTAVLAAASAMQADGHGWVLFVIDADFDRIDGRSSSWVLFVIDADFDRIDGRSSSWPRNVYASENYDLGMDVIYAMSKKIDGIAIAHSRPGMIQEFAAAHATSIFAWSVGTIEPVAVLRHLVVQGRFQFSATNWPFKGVTGRKAMRDPVSWVADHAHQRSGKKIPRGEIADEIEAHRTDLAADLALVTNSHDFHGALAELVGSVGNGGTARAQMAAAIRLTLSCEEFLGLPVIASIVAWALTQTSASVFRCSK